MPVSLIFLTSKVNYELMCAYIYTYTYKGLHNKFLVFIYSYFKINIIPYTSLVSYKQNIPKAWSVYEWFPQSGR